MNLVPLGRFLLDKSIKGITFFLNLKIQIFFSLVRRFYWSDVCTSPTFVLVQRLSWSNVCTGTDCKTFFSLQIS